MRSLLFILFIILPINSFAQTTNHMVEPVGIYKEISMANDTRVAELLIDSNYANRLNLIDSICRFPNNYTPPVLYFLSHQLFAMNLKNEASYWFYVAQLRARYDKNRCADATASAASYNQTFGPQINTYAMQNLDTLEQIVNKVITFVKNNDEHYDQRWINLLGMDAMNSGLSGKVNKKELSLPKADWPAIKIKTINDYYSGFEELMTSLKKKKKVE